MRGWWRKRYGKLLTHREPQNVTPVTPEGLKQYDHLDPVDAVVRAWMRAGDHPAHHHAMRAAVRRQMPLLARALDSLAAERFGKWWEERMQGGRPS